MKHENMLLAPYTLMSRLHPINKQDHGTPCERAYTPLEQRDRGHALPPLIAPRSHKKGASMRATIGRLSRLLLACSLVYGALQLAAIRSESDERATDSKVGPSALLARLPL